jgi:hypothetical protein
MFRKFIVCLATSFIAATGLPAGALAQNAQQEEQLSAELIKEIQSRLFELNYAVWPDGNWDDRTKAAVKSWHQITNRPMSNAMSGDDITFLRTAIPNKVWGGVIYDSKGRYRLFTNEASRKALVDKEIGYCKENFEPNRCQPDVILQTTMMGSTCTGISHADWTDKEGGHSSSSTAGRPNIKAASDAALDSCAKTAPRENCKLLAAVCADGSSQTGELESKP